MYVIPAAILLTDLGIVRLQGRETVCCVLSPGRTVDSVRRRTARPSLQFRLAGFLGSRRYPRSEPAIRQDRRADQLDLLPA